MSYKVGDIVLVKFPFTSLDKSKLRPVLIIKSESNFNDVMCFQITSNPNNNLCSIKLEQRYFQEEPLKLKSFIKYDKCFTFKFSNHR